MAANLLMTWVAHTGSNVCNKNQYDELVVLPYEQNFVARDPRIY